MKEVGEPAWLQPLRPDRVLIETTRRTAASLSADPGIIRSRTSPGGHRQIALSSLLQAQPPPGQRVRSRAPTIPPDEALPQWAAAAADWYGWSPNLHDSSRNLESLLINAQDLAAAIRDVQQAIHSELHHRDESEVVEISTWTSTAMPATS
jgi:hypothetical protein